MVKCVRKLNEASFFNLPFLLSLSRMFFAGIGVSGVVFGLGTPLDHPPETTQWVTAWVGRILYIIYK